MHRYQQIESQETIDESIDSSSDFPIGKRSCFTALVHGPAKPRDPEVTLWWPSAQLWPLRLTRNVVKPLKWAFTIVPLLLWFVTIWPLNSHSLMAYPTVDGQEAAFLRCTDTLPAWSGVNAECGLNGVECLHKYPVGTEFRFKCAANCRRESWTYRPLSAGRKLAYHESFLVGGDNIYRADSFLCAAALHRGLISNTHGGCAVAKLTGPQSSFVGQTGNNSMTSFPFDTEFPSGFEFVDTEGMELRGCEDKRSYIITVSFITILFLGYFSVSPKLFVFSVALIGFWTVVLASNPPWDGGTPEDNAEILSLGARRLLPMMLAMVPVYELSLKGALDGMNAHLSRAIFWCIPYFIGIVENYSFGMIPIDRLTLDDLNGQAGAWLAFFIIAGIVASIVVGQAYIIWRAGKFWPYLSGYIAAILSLAILACLPSQTLRIHHYILALLFLPGTGFQTTPSLVYNGLLTGLFVAGVSRWDFDSIIQTFDQLRRGGPEAHTGTTAFIEPLVEAGAGGLKDVIIRWTPFTPSKFTAWDGHSLLINDVERYRGNATEFNITEWALSINPNPVINYVRVALASLSDKHTGTFTMTGTINMTSGDWLAPLDGKT